MNRFQLENLYKLNGLDDYRLQTTEDIFKTHGIDFKAVEGYARLDDIHRKLYAKFIVNFFNALGLESRATLIPKGIYYVEDINYLVKEDPNDDYYIVSGSLVKAIDKNGLKSVLHSWNDEEYEGLEAIESESKTYLRFEYEHQDRNEWLHVDSEDSWY